MHLKIVPPPDDKPTLVDKLGDKLSESAKYLLIGALLLFVPLSVYNIAVQSVGYEMATHYGFGAGVVCMLLASYLLFFSGWFIDLDW